MNINISIDGVLRNRIQKIIQLYQYFYVEDNIDDFKYEIVEPITNNDLRKHFKFKSKKEWENFIFIDYVLEIFGQSNSSYKNVFADLNNFIYEKKEHEVTLVGLDELGKAKSASLFFLSKNGFMGNSIKFIKKRDISKEWEKCDIWITDTNHILSKTPRNKKCILFETEFNGFIKTKKRINDLKKII